MFSTLVQVQTLIVGLPDVAWAGAAGFGSAGLLSAGFDSAGLAGAGGPADAGCWPGGLTCGPGGVTCWPQAASSELATVPHETIKNVRRVVRTIASHLFVDERDSGQHARDSGYLAP